MCFTVAIQVSLCVRIGGEVTETVAASDVVHNASTSLQEAFISIASDAVLINAMIGARLTCRLT